MSYWNPYSEGEYPAYDAEYAEYFNNMSYYNQQAGTSYGVNSNYNYYDGSFPQNGYVEQAGPSQVTITNNSNHSNVEESGASQESSRNNGAVRKKPLEKNKYWNNGKRYDNNSRYGSGRLYNNRSKVDYKTEQKKALQETADFLKSNFEDSIGTDEAGQSNRNKAKTNQKQGEGKSYYQNKRNSHDDTRRNNYRNNRHDSYDNRYYGRHSKNTKYTEIEHGSNTGREDNARGRNNNWRRFPGNEGNQRCNNRADVQRKLDAASQRERLEEMLSRRMLECLVCYEKVKHTDKIWSCEQCYHIFHLSCITSWVKSSKVENGWRCPTCQNVNNETPKQYTCFCGKAIEPRPVPGVIPHACGEACMKKGRSCEHKCMILCHPGPCPECNVMVSKSCGCGATTQTVKCSSDTEIVCGGTCNKPLECALHFCQSSCHVGKCDPCNETIKQICFCEKVGRRVKCTSEIKGEIRYACGDICGKTLACGNHKCEKSCHAGECEPCVRDVALVKTCPCGKTQLKDTRVSCLDPIVCCDKICGKRLKCGQPSAPHTCKLTCHEDDCPPCPLTTFVRCRCGHMDKELPCTEVTTKADDARCEKKCTKKRLCGKHRCNQRCCIELEHICPLPCNHLLACGKHRCDRTCHSGLCLPCMETSFEELYCECGSNVLYPPIPCGTKPPLCNKPCSRPRSCGHEVNHSCHIGACPPCTVLCKRWCHGKHEQRSAIPCYQEDFGCGLPCGKPMPCESHKCDKPCHSGACPLPCKQKCQVKRQLCGHPCGLPCHRPPCRNTPCKRIVPVSCSCGLLKNTRPCIDLMEEYKELEMASLKEKMSDLMKEQSIDLSDIVNRPKIPSVFKILECTEECRVVERNRRLAIGLQIRNPDLSQKLTPRYSDFMRNWAKKDPQFCQKVHNKLTELVQLAKQSKQKSRSYSFESMNRDKRHFVHECCEHFGCDSAAYDSEPNRNVVATAIKDKSWLPSMSLLQVIQRENGQRKVPGPVLSRSSVGQSESVALKLPGRLQVRPSTPPGEFVDYFDNPPT